MDAYGWLGWGLFKIAATVVGKAGLNFAVPGSAAVVDFVQAGYDLIQGDQVGAAVNAISGVTELVTFGFGGYVKELMKGSGKAAAVSTARDLAMKSPEASKKIGQQLSIFFAAGGIDQVVKGTYLEHTKTTLRSLGHEGLKGLISSGGHDISKNVLESVYEQSLKGALELMRQNKMHTAFQLFADHAKKAAGEEFMKNCHKLLEIEYGLAAAKGGIRCYFNRNDSGAIHPGINYEKSEFYQGISTPLIKHTSVHDGHLGPVAW